MKKLQFSTVIILILSSYMLIPWGILEGIREFGFNSSSFASDFLGFTITPLVFIIQIIICYRWFFGAVTKKTFLTVSLIMLILHTGLVFVPFKPCDTTLWNHKYCTCIGIKKYELFGSSCLGKNTCYTLEEKDPEFKTSCSQK